MSQICLTELGTTPQTPTTGKVRIYVGNDGILRSIDDAGAVTNYLPSAANFSFIQYSNTNTISTSSTTGINMSLDTDRFSNPTTFFTKVNATDFRTDFNGLVIVTYKVLAYTDTNDRGYSVRVSKNGTVLGYAEMRESGKNIKDRTGSVANNLIVSCATNDVFRFVLTSLEGSIITIDANDALASLRFFKAT